MSVRETLTAMAGVWLDHVRAYAPDGTELDYDELGGTPGALPYQQLVYLGLDGDTYTQTNVVFRGRPTHVKTFTGRLSGGRLVFDSLGPDAPVNVGVSGGPGVLVFAPERVDAQSVGRFYDPDYIRHLGGDQRTRTTTLYRAGVLTRVLTVCGTRISTDPTRRVDLDPRGTDGPPHEERSSTLVYTEQESP